MPLLSWTAAVALFGKGVPAFDGESLLIEGGRGPVRRFDVSCSCPYLRMNRAEAAMTISILSSLPTYRGFPEPRPQMLPRLGKAVVRGASRDLAYPGDTLGEHFHRVALVREVVEETVSCDPIHRVVA